MIGEHYIWSDSYHDLGNDSPQDLNESNQVVVNSDVTADINSGGYLWENGTKTYLRGKLPKYIQAQVTDIQPYMISEKAADGTICLLGYVSEGDDWSYVVCTRDSNGAWSFAKAIMPSNVDSLNITAINSDGEIAFTGYFNDEGSN